MIWFDPTAAFARRFEPTDEGYLFYPRPKGPGKLVTPAEYDALVKDYRRWMGGRFRPGLMFAVLFGAMILVAIVSVFLRIPPERMGWLVYPLLLVGVGYMFWFQFAPHRLLKGRPDATPPRTKQELGRATRRMMTWPILIFLGIAALLWVVLGVATLASGNRPSIWMVVWTLFWATALLSLGRTAVQKYRDGQR